MSVDQKAQPAPPSARTSHHHHGHNEHTHNEEDTDHQHGKRLKRIAMWAPPPIQFGKYGFRLAACFRCVAHGHPCDTLANVPNHHRWYQSTSKDEPRFAHRAPSKLELRLEAEARRQGIVRNGTTGGVVGGGGVGRRAKLNDMTLEERSWEPHWHTRKVIFRYPHINHIIMDEDVDSGLEEFCDYFRCRCHEKKEKKEKERQNKKNSHGGCSSEHKAESHWVKWSKEVQGALTGEVDGIKIAHEHDNEHNDFDDDETSQSKKSTKIKWKGKTRKNRKKNKKTKKSKSTTSSHGENTPEVTTPVSDDRVIEHAGDASKDTLYEDLFDDGEDVEALINLMVDM
ncbi:hypothetical protein CI109_107278 [Kwoniella shandongensis]|uniref:Uncharacterized protein n=1 Tax=Kwoniella shandongensis TaxID=1734106 RepID=A0A5M6C3G9_9TREE|nr:uncharacterized protein CI109_002561 [Kwoniella shandongensis]KAA5529220.1 hypothetical protein CI109_002561 [Kwoniella shandongensis]